MKQAVKQAELIVNALLESDEMDDIDVGEIARGGLYHMNWYIEVWHGSDLVKEVIPEPDVPYDTTDNNRSFHLEIKTIVVPKYSGYIAFHFHNLKEHDIDVEDGSVRMVITTTTPNMTVAGRPSATSLFTTYAETREIPLSFPPKKWPELKALCKNFLTDTVRNTFQEQAQPCSAREAERKLAARFRSMIRKFSQASTFARLGVNNVKEHEALKVAQEEFKEFFLGSVKEKWYRQELVDDPDAAGLPTRFEELTLDHMEQWKLVLAKYKAKYQNSAPPPPTP